MKELSLLKSIQTSFGANLNSYPVGTCWQMFGVSNISTIYKNFFHCRTYTQKNTLRFGSNLFLKCAVLY